MGEVGANSAESPHVEFKMNGGVNGNCDDERMDVDTQNGSDAASVAAKKETANECAGNAVIAKATDIDIDEPILHSTETDQSEAQQHTDDLVAPTPIATPIPTQTPLLADGDNQKEGDQTIDEDVNGNADVETPNERTDEIQSNENGTMAEPTSMNSSEPKVTCNSDEVHAISDSDDDNDTALEKLPAPDLNNTSDTCKSNGISNIADDDDDDDDDDKAVSIHSSDSEDDIEPSNKNDDEEDCVVIEDDKRLDDTARPINRSRKSAVRPRDYDDDIEEIIDDPLEMSSKKPRLMDPLNTASESQMHSLGNKSKEPTLVIIDTNTILSRGNNDTNMQHMNRNMPMMPAGGMHPHAMAYPNNMPNSYPNINQMPILSALTDDMFVLEAPSFIVPYIYEKPAADNLREMVQKMATEIEEAKKEQESSKSKGDKADDEDAKKDEPKPDAEETKKKSAKRKKPAKSADDSWDEMDTSTDEEASDAEDNRILIKEAKADLDAIQPHITGAPSLNVPGTTVGNLLDDKTDNYFESPIGKFFMDIGISLVQEHVQTDLLRQQKRKLHREGNQKSPEIEIAIKSLMKNLEQSKDKNEPFKYKIVRCEHCNYTTESTLILAYHYETPHEKGPLWRCSYCEFDHKDQPQVLLHMKSMHTLHARLKNDKIPFQCSNCLYEDPSRAKVTRHSQMCNKKFRTDNNLMPPSDWDPPAKIPRVKPRHGLVGTANAYQAMASQRITTGIHRPPMNTMGINKNRGRVQSFPIKPMPMNDHNMRGMPATQIRPQMQGGAMLPNNYPMANAGQFIQVPGTGIALMPNVPNTFNAMQPMASKNQKNPQQPSISITAVPKQASTNMQSQNALNAANAMQQQMLTRQQVTGNSKPGQVNPSGKFVICEICDGLIKDLDQLRNHMQWMHKVKIHPKMIYNRPPLNCQKCQFRFFTDQGLERHLLGSHGLVTSSMQDAANKGKDAGRCPVCGKMYQWKLLNHVSREHGRTLKPAHLSYKCTVCTATFGMYKQFESHVYSAHSGVAKKSSDKSKSQASSSSSLVPDATEPTTATITSLPASNNSTTAANDSGASLLKQPFKINDEITITPQPATRPNRTSEIESHVID